ncbi:MAG: LLM class F420-dependent oxidoreductase [Gammaproteobacteria bacterium]|nr:LLM class F420-dependent oxidoreductase [Gammaproteobacteria bacterium]
MTKLRIDMAAAGRSLPENIDLALSAQDAGWGGLWAAEVNALEAASLLGAVGSQLGQGRLGTAIVPMQTRDPLLLAMMAASLQQLAPEGFVLGLGTSTPIIVEDWHATPWGDSPLSLTRECVDITRRLLDGERVTTESGRWRYRRAQLARPPERRVPIYLAALNDRMLELAGEVADGVILNFVTMADVRHARVRLQAGADRAGRSLDNFEVVVFFRATETESYEAVQDRYRSELFTYAMAPVYRRMFARAGFEEACLEVARLWGDRQRQEALEAVPEALIRERTLIGTADEMQARLADYAAAGVSTALVTPVAAPGRDEYIADCTRTVKALSRVAA